MIQLHRWIWYASIATNVFTLCVNLYLERQITKMRARHNTFVRVFRG